VSYFRGPRRTQRLSELLQGLVYEPRSSESLVRLTCTTRAFGGRLRSILGRPTRQVFRRSLHRCGLTNLARVTRRDRYEGGRSGPNGQYLHSHDPCVACAPCADQHQSALVALDPTNLMHPTQGTPLKAQKNKPHEVTPGATRRTLGPVHRTYLVRRYSPTDSEL